MNKIIYSLIALVALSLPAAALPVPAQKSIKIPMDMAGNVDLDGHWSPEAHAAWSKNSTCQLVAVGGGKVTRINAFGAPGDNVILFDAAALGTLSNATPDTTKMIGEWSADTAKQPAEQMLPNPVSFSAGVVECPSSATSNGTIEYILLSK